MISFTVGCDWPPTSRLPKNLKSFFDNDLILLTLFQYVE